MSGMPGLVYSREYIDCDVSKQIDTHTSNIKHKSLNHNLSSIFNLMHY